MIDVRDRFLKYFASKGHQVYSSMPLVPNDASLLFTNAGMVQFKDIFTGKIPAPNNRRATSSQLCIRAGGKHNDLENVGYTARHHTLFEMLGNFSFGDYFKKNAIAFAWEFVTCELGFAKERLYVSVHESDDEAYELWLEYVPSERIKRMGDKDNFWQMGDIGPCGPCSEIYYDQGSELFNTSEDYFGGDGDRFLEIWNLVFMQYERYSSGVLKPLPKPSIDTGMGLERVTAILEGKNNNFDTSIFMPLINKSVEISHKPYSDEYKCSHRVIADHVRSIAFLLAQGVTFDKEGRGYVLRRILRRAARHGYLLGIRKAFLYELVGVVCDIMSGTYSYLKDKRALLQEQCKSEEERFLSTIEFGMEIFNKELLNTNSIFNGEVAFKLYDTYGFPLDLTQDMLREQNLSVDLDVFEACMSEQKSRSQQSWRGSGDSVNDGDFAQLLEKFGVNKFVGYRENECESVILALLDSNFKIVSSLKERGYVFLSQTPLYPEGGGPIGDSGRLFSNGLQIAEIVNTRKYFDLNISEVIPNIILESNMNVVVIVSDNRREIAKHHSATHLLHASLRKLLGEHVSQAGSLVESNRLRFDFTHSKSLSQSELNILQNMVNDIIFSTIDSSVEVMSLDNAKAKGAMALFSEKYEDNVRVVSFGDVSCELCGGIHISNTAELGSFYITKESSVSSGVRRIEAVCGRAAYAYAMENIQCINDAKRILKSNDIVLGISKLQQNLLKVKSICAKSRANVDNDKYEIVESVKLLIMQVDSGVDIKSMIDDVKNANDRVAVFLLCNDNGKITLGCGTKGIDLKANIWIKEVCKIIGGGGGGRDDFATAGGRDVSKIDEALKAAREFAIEEINLK